MNDPTVARSDPSLILSENGFIVGVTLGSKQREELRRHSQKPHDGSCRHCAGAIARLLDTVDQMEKGIDQQAKRIADLETMFAERAKVFDEAIGMVMAGGAVHLHLFDSNVHLRESLSSAEERIRQLIKYVDHAPGCARRKNHQCTCGLTAALLNNEDKV